MTPEVLGLDRYDPFRQGILGIIVQKEFFAIYSQNPPVILA
jgi:hypothetical protein